MILYLTKNLHFKNSWVCLAIVIISACSTYKKSGTNSNQEIIKPWFNDTISTSFLYKATMIYKDKSFGGLMLLKPMGKDTTRIQLLTNLGPTLFDLELHRNDMQAHHILDRMNKKLILKALENDMRMLLMQVLKKQYIQKSYMRSDSLYKIKSEYGKYRVQLNEKNEITTVKEKSLFRPGVTASFEQYHQNIPEHIHLSHQHLPFQIELTFIKKYKAKAIVD